jgi:hypothetical protein
LYQPLPLSYLPIAVKFLSNNTFHHLQHLQYLYIYIQNNNNIIQYIPTIPPSIDVHSLESNTKILNPQLPTCQEDTAREDPQPAFKVGNVKQVTTIGEVLEIVPPILPKDIFTRLMEHGLFWPA